MTKDLFKIVTKYRKRLESCNKHKIVRRTLLKLSKLPMTYKILTETRIGWTVGMLHKKYAEYKVLTKPIIRKWKMLVKENNDYITTTASKQLEYTMKATNQTFKKEVKITTEKLKTSKQMSFGEALNNNQPKSEKIKTPPTVINDSLGIQERLYQLVEYVKEKKSVVISQPSQHNFLVSDDEFMNLSTSRKRGRTALLHSESEVSTDNSGILKNPVDCIRFLTTNIDVIVNSKLCLPFETARPILENCNAGQLNKLEAGNKAYLKQTNYIWKHLCKTDFKKETTNKNESLAWKSVYEELRQNREDKLQAVKNKILNKKRRCDLAKNKTVLIEAGWTKRKHFKENETSSFSSTIRPAVIEPMSYRRPFRPEEIKKKTAGPLMAKARKQLKNRFQ